MSGTASVGKRPRGIFIAILILLPVAFPLCLAEVYLRLDGEFDTYAEKTGNTYRSYYNQEPEGVYWNYPPNTTYIISQSEFGYPYNTNEVGLREKRGLLSNWDTASYRVLTLGDSFTEGFGAPADSAWPRVLESYSVFREVSEGKHVEVYNAGMAGSDPFFNYRMLRDKLLEFKPDLVIQSVNTSDLSDYLFRGGLERFSGDHVEFRTGPWWEILYRFSYTFRLFLHRLSDYNSMLVHEKDVPRIYEQAVEEYYRLFTERYTQLADSVGFSLVFVVQPMRSDLLYPDGWYVYMRQLDQALNDDGCVCIDLFPSMQMAIGTDRANHYSWKYDGHYNSKGYWVMGSVIADTLVKISEVDELDDQLFD